MNTPEFIAISKITDETPNVKTFYFSHQLSSKPGQFVMLWVPGIDQKPFSIGLDNGQEFGLTIFNRGPLTKELFNMQPGERVGITGPYGTHFSIKPGAHYIMIGGGYGTAPLGFLAEAVTKIGSTVDFCVGARTKQDILFADKIGKLNGITVHIATDDGSQGHKGFVTDLLPSLISKNNKPLIVTCGPELMEYKILQMCNTADADCEVSIERFMKCGFGVCGQCCVDPLGLRMCTEGPVVDRATANKLTEFGKYHRDKSGTKIYF